MLTVPLVMRGNSGGMLPAPRNGIGLQAYARPARAVALLNSGLYRSPYLIRASIRLLIL